MLPRGQTESLGNSFDDSKGKESSAWSLQVQAWVSRISFCVVQDGRIEGKHHSVYSSTTLPFSWFLTLSGYSRVEELLLETEPIEGWAMCFILIDVWGVSYFSSNILKFWMNTFNLLNIFLVCPFEISKIAFIWGEGPFDFQYPVSFHVGIALVPRTLLSSREEGSVLKSSEWHVKIFDRFLPSSLLQVVPNLQNLPSYSSKTA